MMINPVEFEAAKARHAEFLRQAEQAIEHQDDGITEKQLALHAMLLSKLGEVMVELGETLQTRYGETTKQAYS